MARRTTSKRTTIQPKGNKRMIERSRKLAAMHRFPCGGAVNGSFKRQWADQHKTITMIIQHACVYMVLVSGILLFAGCAFKNYAPREGPQFDGTPGTSLAGSYKDIGSNGSIKPHPAPSYKISQEPQTDGAITLGGPVDMPDLKSGTIKKTPPSRTDPASDPAGKGK